MDTSKLKLNDPRVKYVTDTIRGKTCRYIVGEAHGTKKETMVLVHGFPDMAFGWRYQIPYFMSLGFQVVVPDMVGYAGTDAPEDLKEYTLKSIADDIKAIAVKFVGEKGQIVLGGHDWGGFAVWRAALWHPELIKCVFSVCTPYTAPRAEYVPLEAIIASGKLTNFTYQLHLAGPEVQKKLQGATKIRQFLNAMYGGRGPNGEVGFQPTEGVLLDNLDKVGPSPLVSQDVLDYYTEQYMLRKAPEMRGPLNWYRTRELNFEEEKVLAEKQARVTMPALFITATKDAALPPWMSMGMDENFDSLTRGEVEANHWALWEAPDQVNSQITKWLEGVLSGAIKASL
jgi:pimeloyl-ACP methyl ester carboxylesterase